MSNTPLPIVGAMEAARGTVSLDRDRLKLLLTRLDGEGLQRLLAEPALNKLLPNAVDMIGCTQGTVCHLEGDVAQHTGLVFDTIKKVAQQRLQRDSDFIELLAVLIHDWRKPETRTECGGGRVRFPGHEKLAADEVPRIAQDLGLQPQEAAHLEFVVRYHGEVHAWPTLPQELKTALKTSPYFTSLALLQEADSRSDLVPGGGHKPVHWEEMMRGVD